MSGEANLIVRAQRAVLPNGIGPASIRVQGGKILEVGDYAAPAPGAEEIILADDEVLMPGLIDTHIHINEPGRTHWEGFETSTKAAAKGGVTMLIDMPLNAIPPTNDVESFDVKRDAAQGQLRVDVGLWGGAVPGNTLELRGLWDAGVMGFKCFMSNSGVDEFQFVTPADLNEAVKEISTFDGMLMAHAEDDAFLVEHQKNCKIDRTYQSWLDSRPAIAERIAIENLIAAARETGARVHVVHLVDADSIPIIRKARQEGVRITAETCAHYLYFTAEEIPDGATEFKCAPPIRSRANREKLWEGLQSGDISFVTSDHSPCTVDLKKKETGEFAEAWGGISSVQLLLPILWTEARKRGFSLLDVVRWLGEGPSQFARISNKGRLAAGYDADFSIFAPEETFVVDVAKLEHRNPITPYHGHELAGVVRNTWLRGEKIDLDQPHGQVHLRES